MVEETGIQYLTKQAVLQVVDGESGSTSVIGVRNDEYRVKQQKANCMDVQKIQLARIYNGNLFKGFGIAVNGKLLDRQLKTDIDYGVDIDVPRITVVFYLTREEVENGPALEVTVSRKQTGTESV
ncbi:hypothetical protein Q5512_25950 [Escherichia coli]|nr:hypothetical protein [Escherichia coli]